MKIEANSLVFLDTSALVAIMLPRDSFHSAASRLLTELYELAVTAVTTEFVVFEFANFLSKIDSRSSAVVMIDNMLKLPNFKIVWSNSKFFDAAYSLYKTRQDKEWSLTDCASFVVMKEHRIKLAFTSDKHFEQAGFVKLLEN